MMYCISKRTVFLACGVPALLLGVALLVRGQQEGERPAAAAYVGVRGCRDCHGTRSSGDQYGIWLKNKHSTAYKTLFTPEARDIATKEGIADPTTSERCLSCHVTGAGKPPDMFMPSFSPDEGVGCEACHGPGSAYSPRDTMDEANAAYAAGLIKPDEKTCIQCHNSKSPTFKEFKYAEELEKIKHPVPEKGVVDTGGIEWLDDYAAGQKKASETGRPIMLSFFYSKACPICEPLAATLSEPGVVAESKNFVCVRLLDKPSSVHKSFGYLDAAIVFFTPDGVELKGMYGDYPPELLVHMMQRARRVSELRAKHETTTTETDTGESTELTHASLLGWLDRHGMSCGGQGKFIDETYEKVSAAGRSGERALAEAIWTAPMYHPATMEAAAKCLKSPDRKGDEPLLLDLLAFLYDPSPHARGCAVTVLGKLGNPAVTPYIMKYLLADSNGSVMSAAFRALRDLKDPACIDRVFRVIESPSCCYLRECPAKIEAAAVLYTLAAPTTTDRLIGFARADAFVRRSAIAALGEIAAVCAAREKEAAKELTAIVRYLLTVAEDRRESFENRNEALYSLGKVGRNYVMNGEPADDSFALERIPDPLTADLKDAPTLGKRIMRQTADANAEFGATACEMQGGLRAFESIPLLENVMRTGESQIPRAYALLAVCELLRADSEEAGGEQDGDAEKSGPRRAIGDEDRARLMQLVDDMAGAPSLLERSMAAEWLARLGDPAYLGGLRETAALGAGPEADDRKALALAAAALCENGVSSAVPAVVRLLHPADMDTTRMAAIALSEMHPTADGVPALVDVPLYPPRLFFACSNAPSVGDDRRFLLTKVAAIITPWRLWLVKNGGQFMAGAGKSVAGPEEVSSLEAKLILAKEQQPEEEPDSGEYHLWLQLTFKNREGATMPARGLLQIYDAASRIGAAESQRWWDYDALEPQTPETPMTDKYVGRDPETPPDKRQDKSPSGDKTPPAPDINKPLFSQVVTRRNWTELAHESEEWTRDLATSAIHSAQGSLFVHIASGFSDIAELKKIEGRTLFVRYSAASRPVDARVKIP
ncbi:MAG: multiheme c-type cytochrome [Planctomycetota bacterium]|nr:multiheme c-type cytochrome [Planctomycetota bacterium]